MKLITPALLMIIVLSACKSTEKMVNVELKNTHKPDFTIAFGSCNKSNLPNILWDDVLNTDPDVWIWGGDIVYADTDNMSELKMEYEKQDDIIGYKTLKNKVPVIGTWDDHDYGVNDGGVEYKMKKESQQHFLDFMEVSSNDPRRNQEGVYAVHNYELGNGSVRVIVLDTRYFRTELTKDIETEKRNKPNVYGDGTILGETQWQWLENELNTSTADFNIIVSSIQVLSYEHGFETWGNFPHEVDKLKNIIATSKAKGVAVISGDRHISEFSKTEIEGISFPLIDFTSSGLTHVYSSFTSEDNKYRVGDVVPVISFGTLNFNFDKNEILFQIIGDNGVLLGELRQAY
jgi:alkaline phosphatase D